MKVRLVFEYEIKESDGCGTYNDAYITAIKELESQLECPPGVGSTDDAIAVFTKVELIET